jgi:hypothetical protein
MHYTKNCPHPQPPLPAGEGAKICPPSPAGRGGWGVRAILGLATFLALCATGCGSSTATVEGTVTYQGKPVNSGSVILYCEDKQIVRGLIVDGQYSIPNVPCGNATVTVQAHARVPSGLRLDQQLPPIVNGPIPNRNATESPSTLSIPLRYSHPEESGLSIQIDSAHVTYGIDLKP